VFGAAKYIKKIEYWGEEELGGVRVGEEVAGALFVY
jgi:hypothetical protein